MGIDCLPDATLFPDADACYCSVAKRKAGDSRKPIRGAIAEMQPITLEWAEIGRLRTLYETAPFSFCRLFPPKVPELLAKYGGVFSTIDNLTLIVDGYRQTLS